MYTPTLKVLVTGSTGLIGSQVVYSLRKAGHQVTCLVRHPPKDRNQIFWNPATGELHNQDFENLDAVIHLAGKNIAAGRWTKAFKDELFLSRCRDSWLLSQVLLRLNAPPKCMIVASAVGIYGDRGDEILTEESAPGRGFLADLCQKWEQATEGIEKRGVRVVHTRFGTVLSQDGGALTKLMPSFRLGLGAVLGSGRQFFPWVALDDVVRAIYHILLNEEIQGPVNVVGPELVTQETFARTLAAHVHRPQFLRVPQMLLKVILGEMAEELLLSSQRVLPKKLNRTGFEYRYPTLVRALSSHLH